MNRIEKILKRIREKKSAQPTDTQRIEALEAAVADMMLLQVTESEGTDNA